MTTIRAEADPADRPAVVVRAARRRPDAGAAALETTGLIVVAAALVVAISLAVATQPIAAKARQAICMILSLGFCDAPTSPQAHLPTAPCVVGTQTASAGGEVSVLVIKAGDNRSYEVARLSDGRYRVTLLQQSELGGEVGLGGGLNVTVADKTVGGSATADASAALALQAGQTWYVDSQSDVQDLLDYQAQTAVKDYTVGNGPTRWLVDWGQKQLGLGADPPAPDETTIAGGAVLNAGAEATGLVNHAGASVGSTRLLGVKVAKNGDKTVYLSTTVEGEAGLQTLGFDTSRSPQFQGADVNGSLQLVTSVTYDSSGAMKQVSTVSTAAGESKGLANAVFGDADPSLDNGTSGAKVYTATLPIRTDADRRVANQYLAATGAQQLGGPFAAITAVPGAFATSQFLDASRSRGFLTQQTYSTDNTTDVGAEASGKLGIELGAGFEVTHGSSSSTGAQYWDGVRWQDWSGCK